MAANSAAAWSKFPRRIASSTIQDLYVFDVVKGDKGRNTLKTVPTARKPDKDGCFYTCPLK